MAEFALDPAFVATSHAIADLPLCHARLQADARYPWIVLIPRLPGLREVEDVSPPDRARLIGEAVLAGTAVRAVGAALGLPVEKLNLAALGNLTPQLHLHVVGRHAGDPAWPGPVWGHGAAVGFGDVDCARALAAARNVLLYPHP